MYDPYIAKSFSQYKRKPFRCCAFMLCLIYALGICLTTFGPHLCHPLSAIGAAVNLQLPTNAFREMVDDMSENSKPRVKSSAEDSRSSVNATNKNMSAIERKKVELMCRTFHYCEIEGDVRIHADFSTIFVVTSSGSNSNSTIIEPYPRKGTTRVKNWILRPKSVKDNKNIPHCTQNHSHPAVLFSVGGFSGNFFHDFADVLFPLYSTSFHFHNKVHFLVSNYKQWWINKYRRILDRLTKHEIVDIDTEKEQVHCYNKMITGLKFQRELVMNPSLSNSSAGLSMQSFRQLLGQAYSLKRQRAIRLREGDKTKPRLMIISRQRTRILTNVVEVSRLARMLGFEVVIEEASTDVLRFARTVNSCDVLLGIHGAGLTNLVFLPDNAVLIQVLPYGNIDGLAKLYFEDPTDGMNLRYLGYKVTLKESSLIQQYPADHSVLRDPESFKRWNALWSIYLSDQNVSIDLHRFNGTLVKALRLLRH